MFTKSQLVATAALVASASSVVASPFYNDVTDIEARAYTRDALLELKRRAILDYIDELEARDPNGKVAGAAIGATTLGHAVRPALANIGKTQQTSATTVSNGKHQQDTEASVHHTNRVGSNAPAPAHPHVNGRKQTTTATKQHTSQQHLASGKGVHSGKLRKTTGSRHNLNLHRLPALHGSSERTQQALVKESSSSTHQHSGQRASVNSPVSAAKVPHSGARPSYATDAIKRSVLEYLEDLAERAPTEATPASGATKGITQSTPAGAKVPHSSNVASAHKESEGHAQHPSNVLDAHKEAGSRAQRPSTASTRKETEGSTHRPSLHRQKPDLDAHEHKKALKPTSRISKLRRPHISLRRKKQRVSALSQERNSNANTKANGHKETAVHDSHLTSPHAKTAEQHRERVKPTEVEHNSPSKASGSHVATQNQLNTPSSHASPAPAHQKQQTLKTREFEELAELIARELDLYDELD